MKVIDTFMFRNEVDMLEARLTELEDTAAAHVLVEAPVTHRGVPKPLYYAENRERFTRWNHKIVHVVADLPDSTDPWVRERAQRDAALPAIAAIADGDDIIIAADVDEFPPLPLPSPEPLLALLMRLMLYAVDWEHPDRFFCSVLARWAEIRGKSLAVLRDGRSTYPRLEAGMHLTWHGGIEEQRVKLGVHCHTEMRQDEYDRINDGWCYTRGIHQQGDFNMVPVDVDETWPRWIWERKCPENWFRPRST